MAWALTHPLARNTKPKRALLLPHSTSQRLLWPWLWASVGKVELTETQTATSCLSSFWKQLSRCLSICVSSQAETYLHRYPLHCFKCYCPWGAMHATCPLPTQYLLLACFASFLMFFAFSGGCNDHSHALWASQYASPYIHHKEPAYTYKIFVARPAS